ncbi:hypothetical protein N0O92_15185 [Alkalihalobacillus sp. MEB130]|uniref:hypothetical protein n=1 Tax=Alkalihalobacillus sp. MEB130 TaxID=2976704 RepID=UPI0028DDBA8E|nr:hypothetical protein [Alkalihalobacillus sp. MEB130]MDT8861561.1 hypothetical protein [Alkalihalobacillus sp. MEB130]
MSITQHHLTRVLGVICYVTSTLYLIEAFFPSNILKITYSILCALLLFSSIFYLTTINRLIVTLLLTVGTIGFILESGGFYVATLAFGENVNLLSLFLLIPIIGTFMSTAGYLSALKDQVQSRQKKAGQHPYRLSFILTATMSTLLNFGSMAIVKRIADESFTSYRNQALTLTIMRAFATSMLWSPYFVNVGLVLVLFDVAWFSIGGYGLLLATIYIAICIIMFKQIHFADDPVIETKTADQIPTNSSSIKAFLAFCFVLISFSFLLDYLLPVKMLTVVTMLAVVLPLFWAIFTKILRPFIHDVVEQVESSFIRLKNELAIFISAGYLGMAMALTDVGSYLSAMLFQVSFGSVFIISLLLVILATLLAQIGIHPVIIVIGIGSALSPDQFGVSPEYLALLILIAWTVSTQISPFSGQVLMAAKLMNQPARVIIKQNVWFISIIGVTLTTCIYLLHLLNWL